MRRISIKRDTEIEQVNIPEDLVSVAVQLVDDPWRYFARPTGTFLQAVETLVQDHVRWDAAERAVGYMQQAFDGQIARRSPLTVAALDNERYLVEDGNSTLTAAIAAGWVAVACQLATVDDEDASHA